MRCRKPTSPLWCGPGISQGPGSAKEHRSGFITAKSAIYKTFLLRERKYQNRLYAHHPACSYRGLY